MTTRARDVLRDCEAALADLRSGPTGYLWRTRWNAAISRLRTVGYALKNGDGERSAALRAAVDAAWAEVVATKPEPIILWEFIDAERHKVEHESEFGAHQHVTARPGSLSINGATGESGSDPAGPTTYEHVMGEGPFAGQDPRDVVQQAIEWWRQYLDDLDRRAREDPWAACPTPTGAG
jgi:hypothetical protein